MRIDQLLIGLVVFSMFMVGGALIFNDLSNTYELTPNMTSFNGTTEENSEGSVYNILADMDTTSKSMKGKILGNESSVGDEEAENILFSGGYSTLKLITGSFKLTGAIMNKIASTIGIPSFIIKGLSIILLLSVVFAIIYLIFRYKP